MNWSPSYKKNRNKSFDFKKKKKKKKGPNYVYCPGMF